MTQSNPIHSVSLRSAALPILTVASLTAVARADAVVNPYLSPDAAAEVQNFFQQYLELQALQAGNRFNIPSPVPTVPTHCVNTAQQNIFPRDILGGRRDERESNPADRDYEIFWSYFPDGISIEASPPAFLNPDFGAFFGAGPIPGQTRCPVTPANCAVPGMPGDGFPASLTDNFQSALFQTMNGLPSPLGFQNLGGQVQWQTIVARAFQRWDEVSAIDFQFTGGNPISTTPNGDSGNPWDQAAFGFPTLTTGTEGDIRITAVDIDGPSQSSGIFGNILAYVYPVGIIPVADPDNDPMGTNMDPTMITCNWGYQGNIILDKRERWSDPATPNLLDIVMTRCVGQAIGLLPTCAADPTQPFSVMENQTSNVPLPQLLFSELQEDDIRAVQTLYGDPLETNDIVGDAFDIPIAIDPGVTSVVFAPHLMIPPGSMNEVPLPLSISNNLNPGFLTSPGDTDSADVDRFRLAVPASTSGGFLLNITVQPVGTPTQQLVYRLSGITNDVSIVRGSCDQTQQFSTDPINAQDLRIRVESFDPFTNIFTEVTFANDAGIGQAEVITGLPVNDGIFYISVEGDGATEIQLYNITVEIQQQTSITGMDVQPLLNLVELDDFDRENIAGDTAKYAVIDGQLATNQLTAFGGRALNTVAWPGVTPAVTQIGSHATTVAALALGDMDTANQFRGVASNASFYSASVASTIFPDGSFAVGKTAVFFAVFGLADPVLSTSLGLPAPASVINSVWSGGGRTLNGSDSISQIYDAAVSMHGVTIVSAAGNNGRADPACRGVASQPTIDPGADFFGSRSIVPPATAMNGISVGAVGTSDATEYDIIANFSSKGPIDTAQFDGSGTDANGSRSGIDIVAPGTGLTTISPDFSPANGAPLPPCGYNGSIPIAALRAPSIDPLDDPAAITNPNFFAPVQGTSMASAVVAGAVSLLQDAGNANGLRTDPIVMKAVLLTGAKKLPGWTNVAGNPPAKPQDQRNGAETNAAGNIVTLGSTQPLDVAQGAGVLNFRRSLEIYLTGYGPEEPDSATFAGPTQDPAITDPAVPTVQTPPNPQTGMLLAGPSISDTGVAVQQELPLTPIDIATRLKQATNPVWGTVYGQSLQFGGKKPDLKNGRGPVGTSFNSGPLVPVIVPSISRRGDGGGGGGGGTGGGGGGTGGTGGGNGSGATPVQIDPIIVDPIGWDTGNIDNITFTNAGGSNVTTGFIDYVINVPLLAVRPDPTGLTPQIKADQLTITLTWLREVTYAGLDFSSQTDPRLGAIIAAEFENLDLFVFAADALGKPLTSTPIASSISVWSNVEHLTLPIPQQGTYLIRVQWTGNNYDLFTNRPNAEVPYALAWRVDFSPRTAAAVRYSMGELTAVLLGYGGQIGSGVYNMRADINLDGKVNFSDVLAVLGNWAPSTSAK